MSEKRLPRRSPTSDSESSTSSSSNSDSDTSDAKTTSKGDGKIKKGLALEKASVHSNRGASCSSSDENKGKTKKRRKLSGSDSGARRSFSGDEVNSEDFSPLKKLGKFSGNVIKGSVSEAKDETIVSQRLPEINGDEILSSVTAYKLESRNKLQNSTALEGLAVKTNDSTHLQGKQHNKERVDCLEGSKLSKSEGKMLPLPVTEIVAQARFEEFKKSKSVERSSRARRRSSSSESSRANANYGTRKHTEGVSQRKPAHKRSPSTSSETGSSSSENSRDSPQRSRTSSSKAKSSKTLSDSGLTEKNWSSQKNKSQLRDKRQRSGDHDSTATNEAGLSHHVEKSKSKERTVRSKKASSPSTSDTSRSSSIEKTESGMKGQKARRSRSSSGEKISRRRFISRAEDKIREQKNQHRSMERKYSTHDKRSSSAEKNYRSSSRRSDSRERRLGTRRRRSRSGSADKYFRNQVRHRRSRSRSRSPRYREIKSTNTSGRYAQQRLYRRSNSRSRDSYHHRGKPSVSSHARSRSREPVFSAHQDSKYNRNTKTTGEATSRRRTSSDSQNYDRSGNHHGHRREGKTACSLVSYDSKDETSSGLKFTRLTNPSNQSSRFSKDQTNPGKRISDSQKNNDVRKRGNSSTPTKKNSRNNSAIPQLTVRQAKLPGKDSTDSSSSDTDSSTSSDVPKRKKKSRERKSSKKSKKKKHKKLKKSESRKLKKKSHRKIRKKSTAASLSTSVQNKISAQDESKTIGPDPIKLIEESKKYAPKSQHEWEKEQSVIRKVADEQTGRVRLIKGSGEVIESIVSKQQHKNINKAATKEDGLQFQLQLKSQLN